MKPRLQRTTVRKACIPVPHHVHEYQRAAQTTVRQAAVLAAVSQASCHLMHLTAGNSKPAAWHGSRRKLMVTIQMTRTTGRLAKHAPNQDSLRKLINTSQQTSLAVAPANKLHSYPSKFNASQRDRSSTSHPPVQISKPASRFLTFSALLSAWRPVSDPESYCAQVQVQRRSPSHEGTGAGGGGSCE